MQPMNIPAQVPDVVQKHLDDKIRLAERLSRARMEQARAELRYGSELEAERLARVWLEGDLGRALAQGSIEEANLVLEARADGAEMAAASLQRAQGA